MAWKWISSMASSVKKMVNNPFLFISDLITPNSGKSSKRFLYLLSGFNILGITWFVLIVSKRVELKNVDLIKYMISSQLWIILGLAGIVSGITIANVLKGIKPPDFTDKPENEDKQTDQDENVTKQ